MMTKSQVRKLGERLRQAYPTEADLRLLDEYRKSFAQAYQEVESTLRHRLRLAPTGREAKTNATIVAKLRREKTELSSMQDIAGCRVVVENRAVQTTVAKAIVNEFPEVKLVDRCQRPSHGYRAVHVIVKMHEKLVEIQVRTELQHAWALFSEKLSGSIDPAIKYGGGPPKIQELLLAASELIYTQEMLELGLTMSRELGPPEHEADRWLAELDQQRVVLEEHRRTILGMLQRAVEVAEKGVH